MKKISLTRFLILAAIYLSSCNKPNTLVDRYVGVYSCRVERLYWYQHDTCGPDIRRLSDTNLVFRIDRYGTEGIILKYPISKYRQAYQLYDTIVSLGDYINSQAFPRGDTFFSINPSTTRLFTNVLIANDSIYITQEDGHTCTRPIYLYKYRSSK